MSPHGDAGWTQRQYQVTSPKAFLEKERVLRKPPGCQSSCLDWGHEIGQGSQGTGRTGAWTLGLVGGLHPSWSAFSLVGVSTINHGRETINLPGRTRCSPVACPSLCSKHLPRLSAWLCSDLCFAPMMREPARTFGVRAWYSVFLRPASPILKFSPT